MNKHGTIHNFFTKRIDNLLLMYHLRNAKSLEFSMEFHKDPVPEIVLYEFSYNLLKSELFPIPKRSENMISKRFVRNDAITIKNTIRLEYLEKNHGF